MGQGFRHAQRTGAGTVRGLGGTVTGWFVGTGLLVYLEVHWQLQEKKQDK